MKKEKLLEDLDSLIEKGHVFNYEWTRLVPVDQVTDCQYWFSRCGTVVQSVTGIDMQYYDQAITIIQKSKRNGGLAWIDVQLMIGFLREFRDAIADGLIGKIENEITAKDFNGFLDHAFEYLEREKKYEAAVICSALFEDCIKRLATKNGFDSGGTLESTINCLKRNNIISKVESQEYKYFASIRNTALHANVDKLAIDDVKKLYSGVSKIIKEYLGN